MNIKTTKVLGILSTLVLTTGLIFSSASYSYPIHAKGYAYPERAARTRDLLPGHYYPKPHHRHHHKHRHHRHHDHGRVFIYR